MKCGNCNQSIPDATAKFCPFCGAAVQRKAGRPEGMPGGMPGELPGIRLRKTGHLANRNIDYGTGVVIWLWIGIIVNAFLGVFMMVKGNMAFGLFSILTAVLYVLLWNQKNIVYFYGICILTILTIVVNFTDGHGTLSLVSLLNPLATCMMIQKYYFDGSEADSGLVNRSNINAIFAAVLGLINAALVFGNWFEINVFSFMKPFSLIKTAAIINDIRDIFGILPGNATPPEVYAVYVIAIYLSIAAGAVCILEILNFVFTMIKHKKAYSFGKKTSAYTISVAVCFIASMIFLGIYLYLGTSNNHILGYLRPTAVPVVVLILGIVQNIKTKHMNRKMQ